MHRQLIRVLMAVVAAYATSAQADIYYSVTDIGTLGGKTTATALNNLGQVAGYSETGDGNVQAFLSTNGSIQALGTLGGASSYAYGLNDAGTVVGSSNILSGNALMTHAFSYGNGVMTDIAPKAAGLDVRSLAKDINNAGQVVGYTVNPNFADMKVFFINNSATTVMSSPLNGMYYAAFSAINNAGVAVGGAGAWYDNRLHALTYNLASGNNKASDISKPEQWLTDANAISENGIVVGDMANGSVSTHAFVYANGAYVDLGTEDRQFSSATGVNDEGQVVGYVYNQGLENSRAFLYSNGSMTFLDTLVDPTLGLTFSESAAINNFGQIVVNATNGHSYLLSAVPEPISLALFAEGIGFILIAVRRSRPSVKLNT